MKREPKELVTFSLSFLDVICCALGAILLLFVITAQTLTQNVSQAVQKYRLESERANEAKKSAEVLELKMREARARAESEEKKALTAQQLAVEQERIANESAIRASKSEQLAKEEASQLKKALEDLQQTLSSNEKLMEQIAILTQMTETMQKKLGEAASEKGELSEELSQANKQLKSILDKSGDEQTRLIQELRVLRDSNGKKDAEIEELKKTNQLLTQQVLQIEQNLKRQMEKVETVSSIEKDRDKQNELAQRKIEKLEEQLKTLGAKSIFGIQPRYRRVVFVLDRSGSIGKRPDIKELIINSLSEILLHCEIDEFGLVAFSSDLKFFPGPKGVMKDGREEHKKQAVEWYRKCEFLGKTHVREGIIAAYENYGELDAIFVLTDGLPQEGEIKGAPLINRVKDYVRKQVDRQHGNPIQTKIIAIAMGVPQLEHEEVYEFLQSIAKMTKGQYLGR